MSASTNTKRAAEPDAAKLDETARRLLNLLFIFNTSCAPITTEQIISDSDLGYGSSRRDSDKKKFRRDRDRLHSLGIVIAEVKAVGTAEIEQSSWELDRDRTFIPAGLVRRDDADLLARAITEHLPLFDSPLERPLRSIRLKALETGAFEADRAGEALGEDCGHHGDPPAGCPIRDALWLAFSLRRAVKLLYINARGAASKRIVRIFGLFDQEGASYLTGLDELTGEIRTFRVDRVERVWSPHGCYDIPADFDIRDYLFLPFDLTEGQGAVAEFGFPAELGKAELHAITHGRGRVRRDAPDASLIWSIRVRDIRHAAAFALLHGRDGMVARRPAALASAWKAMIDMAVSAHDGLR